MDDLILRIRPSSFAFTLSRERRIMQEASMRKWKTCEMTKCHVIAGTTSSSSPETKLAKADYAISTLKNTSDETCRHWTERKRASKESVARMIQSDVRNTIKLLKYGNPWKRLQL